MAGLGRTLGVLVLISFLLMASYANSTTRHALIIGNASYQDFDYELEEARKDAVAVFRTVTSMGFNVVGDRPFLDATKSQMSEAVDLLVDQINEGDAVFFYYSGHGTEGIGDNYLCRRPKKRYRCRRQNSV